MTRKTPPYENAEVTAYWRKYYIVDHLCGLCGNTGAIRTAHEPMNFFCICPNGQAMRALGHIPAEYVRVS
jgi:hypothetical protein